jgi:hypothetical protein
MFIITYALPGKLPLHANTTQIADVRVQEDCSSNSKYYIHYISVGVSTPGGPWTDE